MKKSSSAPCLSTLGTCTQPILPRPCSSGYTKPTTCKALLIHNVANDIVLVSEIQNVTRAPLHHIAICLASEEKFPKELLESSKELVTCIMSPPDDVNQRNIVPNNRLQDSKSVTNNEKSARILRSIRRQRRKSHAE